MLPWRATAAIGGSETRTVARLIIVLGPRRAARNANGIAFEIFLVAWPSCRSCIAPDTIRLAGRGVPQEARHRPATCLLIPHRGLFHRFPVRLWIAIFFESIWDCSRNELML